MSKKRSGVKTNWFLTIGITLILTAVALLLCFFLRGETKVEGNWTVERTGALSCSVSGVEYPFFEYDNSSEKTIKISAALGDESIKSVSLVYTLNYSDEKSITDSENLNHVAMNNSFAKSNLGFDALELKFSKFSNGLQMSLFANSDEINSSSAKYFMLSGSDGVTPAKMQKSYEAQGFTCEQKIK